MSNNHRYIARVTDLILLIKKGDPASLAELRSYLSIESKEIADKIAVSENEFKNWESGIQRPSPKQHAFWKIKLHDYVDEEISTLLRIDNVELITRFCEIIWSLHN